MTFKKELQKRAKFIMEQDREETKEIEDNWYLVFQQIAKEKNLTYLQISTNSNGGITDRHATKVLRGVVKRPNLELLSALADGLEISRLQAVALALGVDLSHERIKVLSEHFDRVKPENKDRAEFLIEVLIDALKKMS